MIELWYRYPRVSSTAIQKIRCYALTGVLHAMISDMHVIGRRFIINFCELLIIYYSESRYILREFRFYRHYTRALPTYIPRVCTLESKY